MGATKNYRIVKVGDLAAGDFIRTTRVFVRATETRADGNVGLSFSNGAHGVVPASQKVGVYR